MTLEDSLAPGMALLMRSYEDELKTPIRSAVGGKLARSLLIQARLEEDRRSVCSMKILLEGIVEISQVINMRRKGGDLGIRD